MGIFLIWVEPSCTNVKYISNVQYKYSAGLISINVESQDRRIAGGRTKGYGVNIFNSLSYPRLNWHSHFSIELDGID